MIATNELTGALALAPLLPGLESPPLLPLPVDPLGVAVLPGWCPVVLVGVDVLLEVVGVLPVVVALGVVVLPGVGCTFPLVSIVIGWEAGIVTWVMEPLAQR